MQAKLTHRRSSLAVRTIASMLTTALTVGAAAGTASAGSAGKALLSASGGPSAGPTKTFRVPASGFHVDWSYTCTSGPGDFGYNVYWDRGLKFTKGPHFSGKTKGRGINQYKGSGNYWLYVDSSCNWELKALAGR